jgi:hypothetical protein
MATNPAGDTSRLNISNYVIRMDLVDVETKELIWTSESYISTAPFGPFSEDGLNEFADKSIDDLVKAGVFGHTNISIEDSSGSTNAPEPQGTVTIPKHKDPWAN